MEELGLSAYFYTSLIFFTLVFLFKPKISTDDRNEIFKVGTRLFFASLIYYVVKSFRGDFVKVNIFLGFIVSSLTYIFYKIFVNGIAVIRDIKNISAFTAEEIIASCLIFSIVISVFSNIKIFNYSISNIILIGLILVVGFKNGLPIGVLTGLSIGLALSLIGNIDTFQTLVFIICGAISGIVRIYS